MDLRRRSRTRARGCFSRRTAIQTGSWTGGRCGGRSRSTRQRSGWTPAAFASRRRTPTTEASGGSGAKPSPKPSSRRERTPPRRRRRKKFFGANPARRLRPARRGRRLRAEGAARVRFSPRRRRPSWTPPLLCVSGFARTSSPRCFAASSSTTPRRTPSSTPRRCGRGSRRAPTSARATRKSPTSWRRSRARFGTDAGSSATGATRGFCRWRSSFERRSSGSGARPRRRRVRTRRSPRTRVGDRRFDRSTRWRRRSTRSARRARTAPARCPSPPPRTLCAASAPIAASASPARTCARAWWRRPSRRSRPGACLRARSLEAPPRRSGAGWTRAPGATANAPSPKPSRGTSGPSRTRLSRGTFARRSNPRSGRGIPRGRAR